MLKMKMKSYLGDIEEITLKDAIESSMEDSYYNQGELECIKEKLSNTQDILTKLLIYLIENDIIDINVFLKEIVNTHYEEMIGEPYED